MSTSGSECVTVLTSGQTVGLAFTATAAILSALSVSFVFIFILFKIAQNIYDPPIERWGFFHGPLDLYVLSLLVADLFQGLSGALNIKWIVSQAVLCSPYCTAQGFMLTIGSTGSAMSTTVIAIHTFVAVVSRKPLRSLRTAVFVVFCIWTYCLVFVGGNIGALKHSSHPFMTPTPFWCWIGSHYRAQRIIGEYFWLWMGALISLLLYLILAFIAKGIIDMDPQDWRKFKIVRIDSELSEETDRRTTSLMLIYPFVYLILVLPLSVVRWIAFDARSSNSVPSAATFAVFSLFSLTGLVNVVVLRCLRPNLLMLGLRNSHMGLRISSAVQSQKSLTPLSERSVI